MEILVNFSGRGCERMSALPSFLLLQDGVTLSRAVDAIERQSNRDHLLPPTSLVAVNGNHAGTLAAPDHRVLRDGDEISIIVS